ncbi:Aste57867_12222 [Aphanomyces stellatus]|uniref:Aste57867_12222 protein n=1 Tax=Aphanomyces stellatus TaxID=120398 RepID=A0A485KVS3_9STRA|nr:hypothetical protein As57867_012177 [Aphanomyces stellatus]VFT89076.1 Aste57867_12222 [Aphanomyces stellatus]
MTKRQRTDGSTAASAEAPSQGGASCVDTSKTPTKMQHPLGIKPWGNCFNDMDKGIKPCRPQGLGRFDGLPDTVLHGIFSCLDAPTLGRTAAASRAWYVFSYHDEFWRPLVLLQFGGTFVPQATWRETYIATSHPAFHCPSDQLARVQVQGFYSDLLFQPFYCAQRPSALLSTASMQVDTIPRVDGATLSVEAFKAQFERPNLPVILTNVVTEWPAWTRWDDAYLKRTCGATTFYAGGFNMTIEQYINYSRTLRDDQPLFIFDRHFATTVPPLAADYTVPAFFQDDLFKLLGPDRRPAFRWLIYGPEGSGSSFHIDPNATCAWNAVLRGTKKWIMFPPEVVPPGVHPSTDGGEVSTPVSLMEWFVTFYAQIKSKTPVHLEGTCRAGEMIFVPRGWWHLVLNTEESLAITQNYVSPSNLDHVLSFLKDKPDQVSGIDEERRPHLYAEFRAALEATHPELLVPFDEAQKKKKATWASLVQTDTAANNAPFSFGF